MGALPLNPGCCFNQALRYRDGLTRSASPLIHSHPFAEISDSFRCSSQVRQKYPQYHLVKSLSYLQTLSLAHFSGLFDFFRFWPHGRSPAQAGQKHRVSLQNEILPKHLIPAFGIPAHFLIHQFWKTVWQVIFRLTFIRLHDTPAQSVLVVFTHSRVQQYASNHC